MFRYLSLVTKWLYKCKILIRFCFLCRKYDAKKKLHHEVLYNLPTFSLLLYVLNLHIFTHVFDHHFSLFSIHSTTLTYDTTPVTWIVCVLVLEFLTLNLFLFDCSWNCFGGEELATIFPNNSS